MKKLCIYCATAFTLVACSNADLSNAIPDNRPDYKTSRTTNPLEIPPDLTQSSLDNGLVVSEFSATDNASLTDYKNERQYNPEKLETSLKNIQSNGDATWIEIKAKPDAIFKDVKGFWLNNGLSLQHVDENIGIMETDWLESKGTLPSGGISSIISRVINGLSDDGKRDKFRARIDFDGEKSYVYLTHYGASEQRVDRNGKIIKSNSIRKDDASNYTWVADSRNPELEIEMLRRLNVYLHKIGKPLATKAIKPQQQGHLSFDQLSDGTPVLKIDSNFNRAWILLGIAIDRSGFKLNAQNRHDGSYQFEKIVDTETGFIFTKTQRNITAYRIGLADKGANQIAVIQSINGAPPSREQAQEILQKISKEIKF